jgi:WD40 repeat protein
MLVYEDHKSVVYALAFSPDGTALASGDRNGSLILRDADGQPRELCASGPKSPAVHAVVYLPDGAVVIGHAYGWHIHRRDADGPWRSFSPPSSSPTTSLALVQPNLLAVGSGDRAKAASGALELWDIANCRKRPSPGLDPHGIRAVAACPAKELVAWATGHRTVKVWHIRSQDPKPMTYRKDIRALALAPDGAALAVAVDHEAQLYDLEKRRERAILKGHIGRVEAVAFSPDGATVATGSWDGTVRLWDARTGRVRVSYKWPVNRVFSLAYAPDGLRLAAGGDLGGVVVWDLE